MLTTTKVVSAFPPADVTIECINDLLDCDVPAARDDIGSLYPA